MPARTAKVDCDIASDRAKPHLAWPSSKAKDVDVILAAEAANAGLPAHESSQRFENRSFEMPRTDK